MMRSVAAATLTLAAICGVLLLATAQGGAAPVAPRSPRDSRALPSSLRITHATLSPAPGDLALAEISFHGPSRERISAHTLQVAVSGPFGDDYMATATPRFSTPGGPRALVLLVNRPSPLLDPASVRLSIAVRASLGAPTVRTLADPFTRPAAEPTPAICDLRRQRSAIGASELSVLGSRGVALAGLGAASAVAEAYDLTCGLSSASSFKRAIEQSSPAPLPAPASPEAPSPTPPAPSPAPPVAKLPGEGCVPTPGYACPG